MNAVYRVEDVPTIAQHILAESQKYYQQNKMAGALVVGFQGDLGAGKTTLMQSIAQTLGITEPITSPTFVIAKWYAIAAAVSFTRLIHIDAYRMESEDELTPLNFAEMAADPKNIICVEWPEKIINTLTTLRALYFTIHHEGDKQENKQGEKQGDTRHIRGPYRYESSN